MLGRVRVNVAIPVIAVGTIIGVACRLVALHVGDVGIAVAIPIDIFEPLEGVCSRVLVRHAVAVIVFPVALFERLRVDGSIGIVTVTHDVDEVGTGHACDLGVVVISVAVLVGILVVDVGIHRVVVFDSVTVVVAVVALFVRPWMDVRVVVVTVRAVRLVARWGFTGLGVRHHVGIAEAIAVEVTVEHGTVGWVVVDFVVAVVVLPITDLICFRMNRRVFVVAVRPTEEPGRVAVAIGVRAVGRTVGVHDVVQQTTGMFCVEEDGVAIFRIVPVAEIGSVGIQQGLRDPVEPEHFPVHARRNDIVFEGGEFTLTLLVDNVLAEHGVGFARPGRNDLDGIHRIRIHRHTSRLAPTQKEEASRQGHNVSAQFSPPGVLV